jgi:hypothetical protein
MWTALARGAKVVFMPKRAREYEAFAALTDKLLAVPRAEIQKRIEQHREQAAKNPRKRGPKPKGSADAR